MVVVQTYRRTRDLMGDPDLLLVKDLVVVRMVRIMHQRVLYWWTWRIPRWF